jgi:hypothetical protein
MRFVTNVETVRKYLKNGTDWVEIKKELTTGEDRRYRTAGMTKMRTEKNDGGEASPTIEVDFAHMAVARVEAYLVDWNEKKKISRAAIEALCKSDFEEIDALIQEHIEEQDKLAKNDQSAALAMSTS